MNTLGLTISILGGVIILFVISGLISHVFGFDNYYEKILKNQDVQNIVDLHRIDLEETNSDVTHIGHVSTENMRHDNRSLTI